MDIGDADDISVNSVDQPASAISIADQIVRSFCVQCAFDVTWIARDDCVVNGAIAPGMNAGLRISTNSTIYRSERTYVPNATTTIICRVLSERAISDGQLSRVIKPTAIQLSRIAGERTASNGARCAAAV